MGSCAASSVCEAAPPAEEAPACEEASSRRRRYTDQAFLIDVLKTEQVRLLKAEFIVDWWDRDLGPLPCRQSVPEDGFLDISEFSEEDLERLTIIAVSYCWVHWDHPDPERYHLQTLAEMLRCFCSSSWDTAPAQLHRPGQGLPKQILQERGMCPGAGDGRPVGVFVDWTGLYQNKPEGTRTPEQDLIFKNSLKDINLWYAHLNTLVWMFTSLPPEVERKSYHQSGWTTFEAIVAGVLTRDTNLLDITDATREAILTQNRYGRGKYLQLSLDTASAKHRVPLTPEDFNELIEEKKFTSGSDKDTIVKPKYTKTFQDLIPSLSDFSASGVGFTSEQVYQTIRLSRTHIPGLHILDLSGNPGIEVPLADFAEIGSLRRLRLDMTTVHGDIRALSALENITEVSLTGTMVSGDVSDLSVMKERLTILRLSGARVSGDLSALSALKELKDLQLFGTQVSGDVGALSALKELTYLSLGNTWVSGDVSSLSALKELTILGLSSTQVSGDVSSLSVLEKLTGLDLRGAQVSGDKAALRNAWVEQRGLDPNRLLL